MSDCSWVQRRVVEKNDDLFLKHNMSTMIVMKEILRLQDGEL